MRPQFYTFQVQNFFDDLFGSSSDFLAQKWPFDPSQRSMGAMRPYVQPFGKVLSVIREKTGKTKKSNFMKFKSRNFFHISTMVWLLVDVFPGKKNLGVYYKKTSLLALFTFYKAEPICRGPHLQKWNLRYPGPKLAHMVRL